jgi:23S rRNA maturation mini-RNase III
MLCDHELFLDWVGEAMVELEVRVNLLEPNHPELDIIHSQMVIVCSKMLKAFLRNGNEKILTQIEQMQKLMRVVRSKQNATAM